MSFADRTPTSPNEALLRTIANGSENPFADRDPQSANEYLLKKIAGEQVNEESPFNRDPQSANEYWLKEIADNGGGGGGVTVESLSVANNGTYTAPEGKAYSPVSVSVPASAVVSGTKNITANGTTDVTDYASANVAVPASAVVSGTKSITENGTGIDVTDYAAVDVAVPSITPTGTINITENGTVDVTDYASADVAVPNVAELTSMTIVNRSRVPIIGYYHAVQNGKLLLSNFSLSDTYNSADYFGKIIKPSSTSPMIVPFPVVAFYNSNLHNLAGIGTPTVQVGGVDTTDYWIGEMTYNQYGSSSKLMVIGAMQNSGAVKIIINAEA